MSFVTGCFPHAARRQALPILTLMLSKEVLLVMSYRRSKALQKEQKHIDILRPISTTVGIKAVERHLFASPCASL